MVSHMGGRGREPYQLYSLAVLLDSDPFYTKLRGLVVMMIMMAIPMVKDPDPDNDDNVLLDDDPLYRNQSCCGRWW